MDCEWKYLSRVLAAVLIGALFIYCSIVQWIGRKKKARLAPCPPGVPLFGNLPVFIFSPYPHHELHRLAKEHGPVMSLRLGSRLGAVISSPDLAKAVLKTHDRQFASRPNCTVKHFLAYGDDSFGFGVYGATWRHLRKIATMELLTSKRIQQFEHMRLEELSYTIKTLMEDGKRAVDSPEEWSGVDMNEKVTYSVMNVLTRVLMNKRFFSFGDDTSSRAQDEQEQARTFKSTIEENFRLIGITMIGDYLPYLGFLDRIQNHKADMVANHLALDAFWNKVISDRRKQRETGEAKSDSDFVDVLLSMQAVSENRDEPLTDRQIKALLVDMLSAGTDTSSVTIEWALSELLRNPGCLKKAQEELNEVVGKERLVVEADIPKLPYLQALVKETLRLHPAGPLLVPHECVEQAEVGGYDILPGTIVMVNVWSIGRNPDFWDHPMDFMPERFLDKDVDVRGQHFELIPFGSGRRSCPGMNLALALVQYALARLLQSFDWSLPRGVTPHNLDMSEKFGLTLPRATHLVAIPSPRLLSHLY